jgi:hypothetical protein
LKVDNFNWDKTTVATLSVVNVDSNIVVTSRDVSRTEFPDALYHSFALSFAARAGAHYDLRTFWYFAASAPRLTQRSLVVTPAGASQFAPIALGSGSYNQDIIIERTAAAVPGSAYTTASMDSGISNTGTSWYEQGYNAAAPTTGLPAPGSTITNQSASDHVYTLAPGYTSNNAALVDSVHSANINLVTPNAFSALSLLTASGHGPVIVDYSINHIDGSSENGSFVSPDWFSNVPIVYDAQGRVDVTTGSFTSVNGNNPRLYSRDIVLTNTTSALTNIHLSWDSANSGSRVAAVFAVSGLAPLTPPFNLVISPLNLTQYVGTAAIFAVNASGTVPFNYQWRKDGSPVVGATNATLVLPDVSTNSNGNYACAVSNHAGGAISSPAGLIVLPLPSLAFAFNGGHLILSWSNQSFMLESTNLTGPWITNNTAVSPYQVNIIAPAKFFRLQLQ